jgi:hypothetical protein
MFNHRILIKTKENMLIQIIIYLFLLLIAIYYVTVFLHLLGISIFKFKDLSISKAVIPFFYWFKG